MDDTIRTYVADSELATLLRAAAQTGQRLRVQAEGQTYEVKVTLTAGARDIWENYDPEAIREALFALRGSLKDVDPDELIRQIKDERK